MLQLSKHDEAHNRFPRWQCMFCVFFSVFQVNSNRRWFVSQELGRYDYPSVNCNARPRFVGPAALAVLDATSWE
jgi:hypothetical protein